MVCGVGLLHAEASSGSITAALVQFYHGYTLLSFIKINSSLIWVILTVIHSIWNIETDRSDDMQYYIAINVILFKLLAISPAKSKPLDVHIGFPHPPALLPK